MKKIIISTSIVAILILILCFIFVPKYLNSGNFRKDETVNKDNNKSGNNDTEIIPEEINGTDVVDIEYNSSNDDNNQKDENHENIKNNDNNSEENEI